MALKKKGGGGWTPSEAEYHINILELLAAFFALKCFCSHMNNCHIQIQIDNITALAYINNMGAQNPKNLISLPFKIGNGVSHGIFGSQLSTYPVG